MEPTPPIDPRFLIATTMISGAGRRMAWALRSWSSPVKSASDLEDALRSLGLTAPTRCADALDRADRVLTSTLVSGWRVVTDGLEPGPNFRRSPVLYVRGVTTLLRQPAIAVVGTREPTRQGRDRAQAVARMLVERGVTVVSGLAMGCDTEAHVGGLKRTIAVLAHGLQIVHPICNRVLAEMIIDRGGCLVSEYPYGANVSAERLLERNGLQSRLSRGVIVVESNVRGGTMHTARFAMEQHRPLAVAVAPDDDPEASMQAGCRKLIEENDAMRVYDQATMDAFIARCGIGRTMVQ